jgi:hypothetical protein
MAGANTETGFMVKCLLRPDGRLVLTTPNGLSLTNFLGSVFGRELVNPDHVSWYSWKTLSSLLARHGWTIEEFAHYPFPRLHATTNFTRSQKAQVRLFNGYQMIARQLFRLSPALADGMILIASQQDSRAEPS